MTIASGQRILAADVLAAIAVGPSCAAVNAALTGSTDTTVSASYVNLAGTSSFSFIKQSATSAIKIDLHMTVLSTVSATTMLAGVLINGTDYDIAEFVPSAANVRHTASGVNVVASGLAAGTYTVQGRWKRTAGSGTLTRFVADDRLSICATEVKG